MQYRKINPQDKIAQITKEILFFEETSEPDNSIIPFFADGFPGLLFHITPEGQWVQPHNKLMPASYLYGQSIEPVTLQMKGNYRIIVFQLYPYVISSLFGVDPQSLKDGCFNLNQLTQWKGFEEALVKESVLEKQVQLIADFLLNVWEERRNFIDTAIKDSIKIILSARGQISVKELAEQLHLTARTLERRFLKSIGISAKDFIQVIKFSQSFEQMTLKEYKRLTDIVYNNGFADQSHFIRVFKGFTKQTPSAIIRKRIQKLS